MNSRRFVVHQAADGRWTFGREDAAFQIFDSKEAAVSAAERFLRAHPDLELVIEDDPAPSNQSASHRSTRATTAEPNGRNDVVWGRRLRVRQTNDGLWGFGPEDKPIQTFSARDAAVLAAMKLVMKRPEIELVVDDTRRAQPHRIRGMRDDG